MVLYYYYAMLIVSLIVAIAYAFIFHKHFDANLTIMAVLVPICNLSAVMLGMSTSIDEALVALKLSYIGGCYTLLIAVFLIFNICRIELNRWIRAACILVSSIVYVSTLSIGYYDVFYKGTPTLAFAYGASYITDKEYSFMHTIFYAIVVIYYLAIVAVVIYSFFKKKQVSRRILILVSITVTIAMVGFFGGRMVNNKFELLPLTYTIGLVFYLIIASRLRLYDASDSVTDSLVEKGDTGFVSFDSKMRYLGSNETAKAMFNEINSYTVDSGVKSFPIAQEHIIPLIEKFKANPEDNKSFVELNDRVYLLSMNKLVVGRFYQGYQLLISDDTKNQQFIKLIQNYNAELEEEVKKKTANIIAIQNKLVVGMATMIESRDNSTGGHIKRTSDCMRFLIEAMKEDNYPGLTESFCSNIIRAAPMHDLGKIAVDDAILRKPGRFTPEEFEVMKTHASEGARIVSQILEGTDNEEFMKIAVNVAHYHHERWDGSGYPEHLAGNDIPFEARIMAIVDVYDALVSKRVYKERMSFEEADKIILEGMGKHFDKSLEPYYIRAREKFENYYRSLD